MGVLTAAGISPASASAAAGASPAAAYPAWGRRLAQPRACPLTIRRVRSRAPPRAAAASKLKTIEYDGYSISVPSSWQVFHLDTDPSQCVRYDINAVYLGNPGANQNCPSNLIGRAQTITITDAGVSGTPPPLYQRAAVAHGGLGAGLPASSARHRVWSVPSTFSTLDQYGQQHEFQASVAHSNMSVTGTYAGDATQVENIIRGMRKLAGPLPGAGAPGAAGGSSQASGGPAGN